MAQHQDDEPGTTPELDVSQAEPEEYEAVGPTSEPGRSLTVPALLVALALIVYVAVVILQR